MGYEIKGLINDMNSMKPDGFSYEEALTMGKKYANPTAYPSVQPVPGKKLNYEEYYGFYWDQAHLQIK